MTTILYEIEIKEWRNGGFATLLRYNLSENLFNRTIEELDNKPITKHEEEKSNGYELNGVRYGLTIKHIDYIGANIKIRLTKTIKGGL